MGIYINPAIGTPFKAKFIQEQAMAGKAYQVSPATFLDHTPGNDGLWGVVWVNNGPFDALGVAFDKGEAKAFFGSATDTRPKRYYLVNINVIAEWDAKVAAQLLKMSA